MKRRSAIARTLALVVLVVATGRRADAAEASALETVSGEIARGLGELPERVKVVAGVVTSDVSGTRGDELGVRLASRVAARLTRATAEARAGDLSVAAAAAARSTALVYLSSRIVAGKLEVTADVYRAVGNVWDRARAAAANAPPGAQAGHAFSSGRVDAEIRAFMPPLLLEQASLHKTPLHQGSASGSSGPALAIACGPSEDGGDLELVVTTRSRILGGRIRGGAFVPDRAADWRDLASKSPISLREPVASLAFAPRLMAGVSDRGGVALDDSFHALAPLVGMPIGAGACVRLDADGTGFSGPALSCGRELANAAGSTTAARGSANVRAARPAPKSETIDPSGVALPAARYDGAQAGSVVRSTGELLAFAAVREASGRLRVSFAGADEVVSGAGSAFVIGDLDLDGVPDIVTSRNMLPGGATELAATTSGTGGAPSTSASGSPVSANAGVPDELPDFLQIATLGRSAARLRLPAPGGVRALAMCPAEAEAAPVLAAIVGDEVWLVRAR